MSEFYFRVEIILTVFISGGACIMYFVKFQQY